ncbi:MAG: hypothetical protein WC099_02720 [Candidatus Paceibacterota bacterium]
MKKSMLLFALIVLFAGISNAQQDDYKLSSLTVSSGEGALSSGIFASATIQNTDTKFTLEVCSSFAQAIYGKNYGDFFIAGSAGFNNNTPWVGPFISFSPSSWISFTTWEGVSAGKDKHPNLKSFEDIQFYFAYNNVKLNYSIFFLQYSVIHFQKDIPNNMPGGGISLPLGKYNVFVGCEYSLRDEKPLYSAGLTVNF